MRTTQKTVYEVEVRKENSAETCTLTTESHAEAERALLRDRIDDALHDDHSWNDFVKLLALIDEAPDPERLLLLLHDYVNPWRRGGEDEAEVEHGDDAPGVYRSTYEHRDDGWSDDQNTRKFKLLEKDRGKVYGDTVWRYRLDFYARAPGKE